MHQPPYVGHTVKVWPASDNNAPLGGEPDETGVDTGGRGLQHDMGGIEPDKSLVVDAIEVSDHGDGCLHRNAERRSADDVPARAKIDQGPRYRGTEGNDPGGIMRVCRRL